MDKTKFECALFDYIKALIEEKGRTPEYGGFKTKIESEDIRLWMPNYNALELQIGHLFFRYVFEYDETNNCHCALSSVRITGFDSCYKSGELGLLGKYRQELKEIENKCFYED